MIHRIVQLEDCPLQFFFGELGFGFGRLVGECGLLISMANCNLDRAWEYFRAAEAKDTDQVLMYLEQFSKMHKGLMQATGLPRRMDGAYDKLLFKLVDENFPMRLLPPYKSFSEESFDHFKVFLQQQYPEWLESASLPR